MNQRAMHIAFKGEVLRRHEANPLLSEPGAAVLVFRGVARSLAVACPDGCGEQLTINLDRRTGLAWRFYRSDSSVSLFPSVWRDTGCKSHFIVWRSKIFWCDWHDELDAPMEEVVQKAMAALPDAFVSYVVISDQLDLVPWSVLSACHRLCRLGLAEAGTGNEQGQFRRRPPRV